MQGWLNGIVGLQRLHTCNGFADGRQHLGVAFAHTVVGAHQSTLHEPQHDDERRHDRKRHYREHPVVGDHHTRDHEHEREVEHPCQATPGKEHRQRFDVARNSGDERTAAFFILIGQAQAVNVVKEAHAQPIETLFSCCAQAIHRSALAPRREKHHGSCNTTEPQNEIEPHLAGNKTLVNRLLNGDRNRYWTRCSQECEHEREPQALTQCRSLCDAGTNGVDGTATAHFLRDVVGQHQW